MDRVEKAKELFSKSIMKTITMPNRRPVERYEVDKIIFDQALSELDEPVCKTCGGSRKVPVLCVECPVVEKDQCIKPYPCPTKPCPDCQQPPEGEFTRKVREYMKNQGVRSRTDSISWEESLKIVEQGGKYLYEACDRLDSLEAALRDNPTQENMDAAVFQFNVLQSQFAKRGEAIKWLMSLEDTEFRKKLKDKAIKNILGDEDFERCTK